MMALSTRRKRPVPGRKLVHIGIERLEDRTAPALFSVMTPQSFGNNLSNNGFVLTGDLDGNGTTDAVLTNYGTKAILPGFPDSPGQKLSILSGNGDGTFTFASNITLDANAYVSFAALGDVNGDSKADLVAVWSNTQEAGFVSVLLGNGGGGFTPTGSPVATGGNNSAWVGLGQFSSGDTNLDIIVASFGKADAAGTNVTGQNMTVLQGDGKGGFALVNTVAPAIDFFPTSGAISDFNGDGNMDVAVTVPGVPPDTTTAQPNGNIFVFSGTGNLTFGNPTSFGSGGALPINIKAADLNADGKLDLITANAGDPDSAGLFANFGVGSSVSVAINNGSGFNLPSTLLDGIGTGGSKSVFAVESTDLTGDGNADIAAVLYGHPLTGANARVLVWTGNGKGAFAAEANSPYNTTTTGGQFLAFGKLDAGDTPDVVVVGDSNKVTSLLNTNVPATSTTTTVNGTPSPTTFGQQVTFTATVTAGTGTPTGTVTFLDGAVQIGTGTLSGGTATLNTSSLGVSVHSITARYEGGGGFATSTSSAFSHTVTAAATTTTVNGTPSPSTFGQQVTFTATVTSPGGTPTGTVTFFDGSTQIGQVSLAGGLGVINISSLGTGPHSITANYAASGNFAASNSSAFSHAVNAAATTTALLAAPSPANLGAPVTLTATVSSGAGTPIGTVTFFDGATNLGTANLASVGGSQKASIVVGDFTSGVHNLTAQYAANGNFGASTSAVFPLTVNGATTTVTISSSLNPSTLGQSVTFTATVSAPSGTPTGTVNFFVDGGLAGSSALNAQQQVTFTTSALAVGTHPVIAKYVGAGQFGPADSPTLNQVVNPVVNKTGTTTTVASNLNPAKVGQLVTFTATVSETISVPGAPTGTVTFKDGATVLGTGTLSGTTATFQTSVLAAGSHTIIATYEGDAAFSASTSPGISQGIGQSSPGLLGYHEFGAGGGEGASANTRFFNPDGTQRFAVNVFPGFAGGVRVTSADFNNDGIADLVAGTGPGSATQVVILDGVDKHQIFSINPFEAAFTGGVFVAAGDITGDGIADLVITPDEGGGPRCRVFNGGNKFAQINDFFGIDDPDFRGGARAAVGDINGDGKSDLAVAAGFSGGPRVALFNGALLAQAKPPKLVGDFFMFEQTLRNGVFITLGDLNGDSKADVIGGGGPGGGPRVFGLSGAGLLAGQNIQLANFFAGNPDNRGGVPLVARDLDGDSKADLVTGAGAGDGSRVNGFLGVNIAPNNTPPTDFSFDAFPGFAGGVFVG